MFKSTMITLLLILSVSFLKAQNVEVPQKQKPLVVKIAASWCPPCGGWGWDFFDDIYADNSEEAIFLSVHHSGDHSNATATEMTSNFGVFGQPRFIFDGSDQNVSSSNVVTKRTSIENMVQNQLGQSPSIQAGISASYSGDELMIDYSVELFEDLSGEYYLGLYLVEKVHIGYQASVGNDAAHKDLLRGSLESSSFGNMLFSGAKTSGSIINGDMTAPLGSYDVENLEVVSVIWKKQGQEYQVVNSNKDPEVELNTTGVEDLQKEFFQTSIYPTIARDFINIEMENLTNGSEVSISLFDLVGNRVYKEQISFLDIAKKQSISVRRPDVLNPGVYVLNIETKNNSSSHKVIFE